MWNRSRPVRGFVLGVALASPLTAGVLDPLGVEFQINTYTEIAQRRPVIGMESNGDFVVVWRGSPDGDGYGIRGQRFASTGAALGREFLVNTYTTGAQGTPAVAADDNGDFVVAWPSAHDGAPDGIFAQRFSSNGGRLGGEFQVNTHTLSFQNSVAVSRDTDGDFVVVWSSNAQDGSSGGVFAWRFSSNGTAQGAEFQVNVYTTGSQSSPDIALDSNGDFVVAWSSNGQDGYGQGVFARRFSNANVAQGLEFQVSANTLQGQSAPAVAIRGDGAFVVVWQAFEPGAGDQIRGRRFASGGTALAAEFAVNSRTTGDQEEPSIALDADGDFVVSWRGPDGELAGVFARRFLSNGAPQGIEFQVNSYTPNFQIEADVATDADGDLVVVWTSSHGQDGESYGAFGQRYLAPADLDVDGDGEVKALNDGLLFLRFAAEFSGPALVSGAVADGCTRCTGDDVTLYLDSLGKDLDVDGDGLVLPLSDAVLALRFLFGFTGDVLLGDEVTQDCTRCEADDIEPFLEELSN